MSQSPSIDLEKRKDSEVAEIKDFQNNSKFQPKSEERRSETVPKRESLTDGRQVSPEDPQNGKMGEDGDKNDENPVKDQMKLIAGDLSVTCLYKVTATSFVRQAIWVFLLMFGAGFMVYQIQDRICYYLTWPTAVEYRLRSSKVLRFPTVTICSETIMSKKNSDSLGKRHLF